MKPFDSLTAVLRAENLLRRGKLQAAEKQAHAVLQVEPENADALYIIGAAACRAGRLEEAEQALRRASSIDPGCATFHLALGQTLKRRGTFPAAIDALHRAARQAPRPADILVELGTSYAAVGALDEAVDCLRHAARHDRRHLLAHVQLGDALRRQGQISDARIVLQRALGLWLMHAALRPLLALRAATARLPSSAGDFAAVANERLLAGNPRLAALLAERALSLLSGCAPAMSVIAQIRVREGRTEEALNLLQKAHALSPRDGLLSLHLARALRSTGRRQEALAAFEHCLSILPDQPEALAETAAMLVRERRNQAADALLSRLQRGRPQSADTHAAVARCRLLQKDAEGAEVALSRALDLDPSHPQALAFRAGLLLSAGRAAEADALSLRAVQAGPDVALAHLQRGLVHMALGRWAEAAASFAETAALDPAESTSRVELAKALRGDQRSKEAEGMLRPALARWPREPALWHELGAALCDLGELKEARECFESALRLRSDHPDTLAALAITVDGLGDFALAERLARRALEVEPDHAPARTNLGLILLKKREWAEGWECYESRKRLAEQYLAFKRFPYPEWDGSSLHGKTLLVYPEQGLGDEIMFASCLAEAAREAAHLVVECDPRLARLFQRSLPGSSVFARPRTDSNEWVRSLSPQPDFQVAIGSLPGHYRRSAANFPRHPGYLQPDGASASAWRERLRARGRKVHIGLSWRGGIARTGRARRSLDLSALAPLLRRSDMHFVSLQYGDAAVEIARLREEQAIDVSLWQEAIDDYDQTAALACELDAVLTVCTSLVHLCGALGRRTFVMAPYSPAWRYGISGETMPWYPSVAIARQSSSGDWDSVLAAVRAWLDALAPA